LESDLQIQGRWSVTVALVDPPGRDVFDFQRPMVAGNRSTVSNL
jgi:hypothetical protein